MATELEDANTEPPSKRQKEIVIPDADAGETPPNPLSKNQQKKQRKLAQYAELRKERRKKERERQKQKRQEAVAAGRPAYNGPTRKELKKRQTAAVGADALCVAIDLDYDEMMSEKDIAKCVKQCLRIYTINRRSERPGILHFTGIRNDGRIHQAFMKNDGWENWHVNYHFDKAHTEVFERKELVYLTAESDTVIEKLETGCVYVIGGLVDHNHQKGLCHEQATNAGLLTARLPLSEHVDMKTRAVLSTFHVFEILMRVAEGKSWTDAIIETLPVRKGAKPKQSSAHLNGEVVIEEEHQTSKAEESENQADELLS